MGIETMFVNDGSEFDVTKLRGMVLMILEKAEPAVLSMESLHHMVYLCDFESFFRFGHGITGSRYIKREWGPENEQLESVLRDMERAGEIDLSAIPWERDMLDGMAKLESIVVAGHRTVTIAQGFDGIWEVQSRAEDGLLQSATGYSLEEAVGNLKEIVDKSGGMTVGIDPATGGMSVTEVVSC